MYIIRKQQKVSRKARERYPILSEEKKEQKESIC